MERIVAPVLSSSRYSSTFTVSGPPVAAGADEGGGQHLADIAVGDQVAQIGNGWVEPGLETNRGRNAERCRLLGEGLGLGRVDAERPFAEDDLAAGQDRANGVGV